MTKKAKDRASKAADPPISAKKQLRKKNKKLKKSKTPEGPVFHPSAVDTGLTVPTPSIRQETVETDSPALLTSPITPVTKKFITTSQAVTLSDDLECDTHSVPSFPSLTDGEDDVERDSPTLKLPHFQKGTIDVAEVRMQQVALIAARTSRRPISARVRKVVSETSPKKQLVSQQKLSVRDAWCQTLHRLLRTSPDFFSSEEATLKTQVAIGQGRAAYKAVPVSAANNHDLKEIFRLEYEPKIAGGGNDGSFKQLCIAAGQLLRLAVVCDVIGIDDMCEPGMLFKAVCDNCTVDLLIYHYRVRAVCTTVMTKAFHFKKLAEHAKLFFQATDDLLFANAEKARIHLRSIYNVQKGLGRQRATDRRVIDNRVARAAIFLPADFARCTKRIRKALDAILITFDERRAEKGAESAVRLLFREGRLRNKWNINLINLLVLTGGGQRPQVYTQLQLPSDGDLRDMREGSNNGFIQMRTSKEKTTRSLCMPYVLFPAFVLKYVEFQCAFVRPSIMEVAGLDESEASSRPLLIHTENALDLVTAQITKTFQGFLKVSEPSLAQTTVMDLRSSYGTMMMKNYRDKTIFPDHNETQFLEVLASQMNTSVEQLRATYIGIDTTDYVDTAKGLVRALALTTDIDNTQDFETASEIDDTFGFFA